MSLEQTLDEESARKVAYAAGLAHGKRRLGTFLSGQGLNGGAESMAMWQDTAHASAAARHRLDGKTEFVTRFWYRPES